MINAALSSDYQRGQTTANGAFSDGISTTFNLSASLLLLDFGRRETRIAMAKETVLLTRETLTKVEQNVLLGAVAAYVDVMVKGQIIDLRNSNVRLVTQELRAAQDRFEVGEITKTDVSIAEARLAAAKAELSAAEGAMLIARESYKAATGQYPGHLTSLSRAPKLPASLEAARSVALKTHPDVKIAQRAVTIADLAVDLSKADFRPTVSATARASINDRGIESQSFGLSLNQELYSGGRKASVLRQSIAKNDGARADLSQAAVNVSEAVGTAWANLLVANATVEAGDRQIRASQTAFDGVREEARLGTRTTLEVLDAEQELLNAKVSRLQSEANRYIGVYNVLASMGLLTVQHLGLGVATYDPETYYNRVKTAPVHSAQGKKLDRILDKLGR